jgi:WD40 repeat protein
MPTSIAQEEPDRLLPEVISAENIHNLHSVMTIDFADSIEEAGIFLTGRFVLGYEHHDNNREILTGFATANRDNRIIVWNYDGDVIASYQALGGNNIPADVIDIAFVERIVISLHSDGETNFIAYHLLDTDTTQIIQLPYPNDTPLSIWLDSSEIDNGILLIFVEILPHDPTIQSYISEMRMRINPHDMSVEQSRTYPYAPATDLNAAVRIGRIPPPYVVTSSIEGEIKLWNLQTEEIMNIAKVENGPAVFGQMNATAEYLAWRDPQSEFLNLLDFNTGENHIIAELNRQYIQGYFVTISGDTILGVNVDFEPIVVAWDVTTGNRIDLGYYRQCNRVPDLIRLSRDGGSLIIGCDTGLDIWRAAGNSE